jgi:hypothetical protein
VRTASGSSAAVCVSAAAGARQQMPVRLRDGTDYALQLDVLFEIGKLHDASSAVPAR